MASILETIDDVASQLKHLPEKSHLVYIGRFCPMHYGHQALIGGICAAAGNSHQIFIGSCNKPLSYRNMFDFSDRYTFITEVFPKANVMPLPDFDKDYIWFEALDSCVRSKGIDPKEVIFVGGCEEDVQWYRDFGRKVVIVNRFAGLTVNISGTEIRDHLIGGNLEKLKTFLDPKIAELVADKFRVQYDKLRKL